MKINYDFLYNEKKAKQLTSSINQLISDIVAKFKELLIDTENTIIQFMLEFDNKNKFIVAMYQHDKLNNDVYIQYIDMYGNNLPVISLQDALNINKYSRDIQNKLDSIKNITDISLTGYYTNQNMNKDTAIYGEGNSGTIINSEYKYVSSVNINELDVEKDV